MFTVKYFTVKVDCSEDGRVPRYQTLASFTKLEDAKKFSKGKGAYGHGDADIDTIEVSVCESIDEVEVVKKEEDKAKALAKLTDEEKKLLGIDVTGGVKYPIKKPVYRGVTRGLE